MSVARLWRHIGEFQNLKVETADGIATVIIDRPQSLNALNRDVVRELECALFELELDAAVKEMEPMDSVQGHAFARRGQRVMLFIQNMKKPVTAAVNGYALGGGLELALAWGIVNEVFPRGSATEDQGDGGGHRQERPCRGHSRQGLHRQWPRHGQGGRPALRASMFAVLFATEDQSEGMGAFVAKRKASFKGQ
jgi:enoyl-CoA hydratase/carnithine racemase